MCLTTARPAALPGEANAPFRQERLSRSAVGDPGGVANRSPAAEGSLAVPEVWGGDGGKVKYISLGSTSGMVSRAEKTSRAEKNSTGS